MAILPSYRNPPLMETLRYQVCFNGGGHVIIPTSALCRHLFVSRYFASDRCGGLRLLWGPFYIACNLLNHALLRVPDPTLQWIARMRLVKPRPGLTRLASSACNSNFQLAPIESQSSKDTEIYYILEHRPVCSQNEGRVPQCFRTFPTPMRNHWLVKMN